MARLEHTLGKNGPLAKLLPSFTPRSQQIALAKAVEASLVEGRPCLAEAGTGVGKTLAYLVPLVRWLAKHGGRAVVSTHTLALQAQLVERDIPALLAALPECEVTAAVLKGRSNFLCLQDLEIAAGDVWLQNDPLFRQVQRWAGDTDSGDPSELDFTFTGWSEICANQDTCRQRECRFYDRCFYFNARKAAEECSLLVVNHALFFADLRLRRTSPGGPTLLPKYDAVVFDEAHHIEEMATRAFGLEWGSRRVPQLVARAKRLAGVDLTLLASVEALNQVLLDPFLDTAAAEAFLDEMVHSEGDRKLFFERRDDLCASMDAVTKDLTALADSATAAPDRERAGGLARTAARISTDLRQVTREEADEDTNAFRWFHTRRNRAGQAFTTLVKTPLAVDTVMQETLFSETPRAVFVSATLASSGKFEYLKQRLGLGESADTDPPIEVIEGSPFDYEQNCLIYVPRALPTPTRGEGEDFASGIASEVLNLVEAASGRTFALFTSHRMLKAVHQWLLDRSDYPLFVQGEMPNARLVEEFVKSGNGVLLGTSSFWEGVDVPGPALSCVIMDKLPFAPPDSPLQRARETAIRAGGGDAFKALSLPQAQIRLKQGFGRLLRAGDDRGVVAILDSRLWTKSYGRGMLSDLPACPRTDRLGDVQAFFEQGVFRTAAPSTTAARKQPSVSSGK
ncbi:MAG: ATP-dependent DNA helicase [Cytophagales bacterium]|nr:ATP-dependent DNA helicase [Armatimonadota bacterium]